MNRPTVHAVRCAFTLLEMAVAIIVVGLMVAFLTRAQHVAQPADNCNAETRAQLAVISRSLESFVRQNNRYPLPSSRTVGVSDAMFGREAAGADIDTIGGGHVYAGALPFQAIGLTEAQSADCWGSKFTYYVTKELTTPGGVTGATEGAIDVRASATEIILPAAAYAIVSHGKNAFGAVKKNYSGIDRRWCSVGAALDSNNCDGAAGAGDAVIYQSLYNDGSTAGAHYFDDLVVVAAKAQANCNAVSYAVGWDVGGNHCTATTGPLTNGATVDVTSASPSGSAQFRCRDGQMVLAAAYSCSAGTCGGGHGGGACAGPCSTQTLHWGSGCSASFDSIADGQTSPSTPNTAPGYSGAATAQCNGGAWNTPSGTCTP